MRHLTAAFLCALVASFCAAVVLRALTTNADSFVLIGGVGVLFFTYRCWAEVRQAWPAFTRHLARRREMRLSPPVIRINLHKDEVQ